MIRVCNVPDYVWADGEMKYRLDNGDEIVNAVRWKFKLEPKSHREKRRDASLELGERLLKIKSGYDDETIIGDWKAEDVQEMSRINAELQKHKDWCFTCLAGWDGIEGGTDEKPQSLPFNKDNKHALIEHPIFESSIRSAFESIGQGEEQRLGNSGPPLVDGLPEATKAA